MYFGGLFLLEVEDINKNNPIPDEEELTDIKVRCRSFVLEQLNQMKSRLPTNKLQSESLGKPATSILLSAYPDYVKKDHIKDHSNPERPLLTLLGMEEYTEEGIIGYPSLSSKEKGDAFLREIPKVVSVDLARFLSM